MMQGMLLQPMASGQVSGRDVKKEPGESFSGRRAISEWIIDFSSNM
jgi:hypothetical protein